MADVALVPEHAFSNGNVAKANASFYEVYGKVTYTWTDWAFGLNEYYSPNFLNTGAWGNYFSGTVKFTAPDKMALGPFGWYASGEFGRQWLGTSDAFYGCHGRATGTRLCCELSQRHSVYELRHLECRLRLHLEGVHPRSALLGHRSQQGRLQRLHQRSRRFGQYQPNGDQSFGPGSNWCGSTFIAKLSADLTLGSLK